VRKQAAAGGVSFRARGLIRGMRITFFFHSIAIGIVVNCENLTAAASRGIPFIGLGYIPTVVLLSQLWQSQIVQVFQYFIKASSSSSSSNMVSSM
jgi:hypothetical protein